MGVYRRCRGRASDAESSAIVGGGFIGLRLFLDRACAARGGALFLRDRGREWSYADLGAITDGAARALLRLGVRPGDRIAMLLPGGPGHLFAWLAAAKLGAIAAPIHTDLAPGEVRALLDHLEPSAIVYDRSLAARLSGSAQRLVSIRVRIEAAGPGGSAGRPESDLLGDTWRPEPDPDGRARPRGPDRKGARTRESHRRSDASRRAPVQRSGAKPDEPDDSRGRDRSDPDPDATRRDLAAAGALPPPTVLLDELLAAREPLAGVPEPGPDDIAEILSTSGTTGLPKAAMIPHRMLVLTGEAFAHWLGLGAEDRLFTCLPFSHINARGYSTMGAIAAGASLAVEPRFSASRFWSWIADSGATEVNAIGAMLKILLAQPEGPLERSHRLRLVYAAPALGETDHLEFERRTGARLVIGYGLTESTFGFIHPLSGDRDLASLGTSRRHPRPDLEADVLLMTRRGLREDSEAPDWREAEEGETGEIWLRNPATFAGYFRDAEATREVFVGPWLRTGDLAYRRPGGSYVFVGRLKQMIRRRGENLSPSEVESVLESHPAVLEAAVIGVPSALGEEEVRAIVALRPGCAATREELAGFCGTHLAAFKIPTDWRFVDRLPRTPTQRIAYHLLRGETPG